jgi:hypothetical protein
MNEQNLNFELKLISTNKIINIKIGIYDTKITNKLRNTFTRSVN